MEFRAPWSGPLRWTTLGAVGLLLTAMLIGLLTGPRQLLVWNLAMVGIPLAKLADTTTVVAVVLLGRMASTITVGMASASPTSYPL